MLKCEGLRLVGHVSLAPGPFRLEQTPPPPKPKTATCTYGNEGILSTLRDHATTDLVARAMQPRRGIVAEYLMCPNYVSSSSGDHPVSGSLASPQLPPNKPGHIPQWVGNNPSLRPRHGKSTAQLHMLETLAKLPSHVKTLTARVLSSSEAGGQSPEAETREKRAIVCPACNELGRYNFGAVALDSASVAWPARR